MSSNTNISSRQIIAVITTCVIGWLFTYVGTIIYVNYAVGLFIWLPVVMGAVTTFIYAYNNPVSKWSLKWTSFAALGIYCIGLLFFAMEGIICIAMAAPLGMFFCWVGYLIGYEFTKHKAIGNSPTALVILILSVPTVMAFEFATPSRTVLRSVTTSIEINAAPEIVWQNVIAFPKLDQPKEMLFKTGVAYPISAQIDGQGVGAIRHCNFSTGSFVEPVTVWDKPRLLKFDVVDQPEPMKEISPYDIHPNHLHDYFVSKEGQFKLTQLPNGKTLLEGTTWYSNNIHPNFYWNIWSDFIVHKIHERVLEHIKIVAETRKGL